MSNVKAIPDGHHSLTPALVCKDAAKAIDFYKEAFGATEVGRMTTPNGIVGHAELQIGDSRIMLSDPFPGMSAPPASGPASFALCLYTENVDKLFEQATKAGCKVEMPLSNQFWGDRFGKLRDPFGHSWDLAQHVEDVAPEEMKKRSEAWFAQMSKAAGQG